MLLGPPAGQKKQQVVSRHNMWMGLRELWRCIEERSIEVGDTVLAKVIRVDHDGLLVRFDGPSEGFVRRSELKDQSSRRPDSYELGTTLWLTVLSLDNVDQPILLSERRASQPARFDGVTRSRQRSAFSHDTESGAPKIGYHRRDDAMTAVRENDQATHLDLDRCPACREYHIGRAR